MAITLVSTATASGTASIAFDLGDAVEYIFEFLSVHHVNSDVDFQMQFNASDSSSWDETVTSVSRLAYSSHAGSVEAFNHDFTTYAQQQETEQITIARQVGNAAYSSVSGRLRIFNPSSTSGVKMFESSMVNSVFGALAATSAGTDLNEHYGYINTTTAIDEIRFKAASGNIETGVIKMYAVS